MEYPVLDILDDLQARLREHKAVILQAPPGAGKSTVIPLKLYTTDFLQEKRIVMLEPRRLAARSVAMRMASMLNEEVGQTVGYRVRFESRVGKHTRIEVVTEGILTRMIQGDSALSGIGMVIFDEFHERSLQADLALALALQVQELLRSDLRILIMSATLDAAALSDVLKAPVVTSSGRQHPVDIRYIAQDETTPLHVRVSRTVKKVLSDFKGDVLAFLPGVAEIQRAAEMLGHEVPDVSIHPLYGDMSFAKQQTAILPDPGGRRKVVLATSIAETSLTIEGITIVVDSGYSRVPRFDPGSGLTRLQTVRVTRDAADQRAGRAGRLGPGTAFRLWSHSVQAALSPVRTPEILEADLSSLVLELSEWGIADPNELTWITAPPAGAVSQAKELLHQLEALKDNRITGRGKEMAKLPTHPRIAHMLIGAKEAKPAGLNVLALAADIAAILEERDPLNKESGADLALRVHALRKWRSGERVMADRNTLERIERLSASWRRLLNTDADNSPVGDTAIGALVMSAYPERIARQLEKNGDRYRLANGRTVRLPPFDPLSREAWLAVAQLDAGSAEGKIFTASALDEADLFAHATDAESVRWDAEREMVIGFEEKRVSGLVLRARPMASVPDEQRVKVLCSVIRERGLRVLAWDEKLHAWQARVMSLRLWRPEEHWPDVSEAQLLDTLETWLPPFIENITRLAVLQKLECEPILSSLLPWELHNKLDRLAPQRLQVPSGSLIRVNYFQDGRAPVMEVRLQEVFGLLDTPAVNEGITNIVLHLLSPGFKPVQVTQDLKSFWKNTYPEVRKELRMRYPKHSWPEDPWTAQPVRGARRR